MKRQTGLLLTLFLLWLVVYPIGLVLLETFRSDAGWTLANVREFARQPQEWQALWASLWISAASVVLAGIIGIPLAFIFERLDFPGRGMLGALVALPAVLPPLVGVIAFLFLYGESGFIARGIQHLLGLEAAPWRLKGAGAILLVHAYSMFVYFYLFARAGLAGMDSSMVEAAQSLGASGASIVRRVTLPLLRPHVGAAALLVFMTSLGSFSAPYIFGGGFRVMTTQIVTSKLNGDMAMSMVETAALAAVAVLALVVFRKAQGERSVAAIGKGSVARRLEQPLTRTLAAVLAWGLAILLLLPHVTLLFVSLVPRGTWTTELLPPEYTISNYARLFSEPERLRPLANSVWMAAVSTLGVLLVSVWAGRVIVQKRVSLRSTIERLLNVPWAVPGTVLAVALATMYSVHAPGAGRFVLVGTALILPLAYLIRNLPIAGGAVIAGFRQLDANLDEAAQSLGAGRWRVTMRITIPLIRPALFAAGALAFATALGDFVTSIVLYSFHTRPISIEILSLLREFDIGTAAAYGVVLMVFSSMAMAVGTRR